jgi:hypothetical protein
VKEETGREGVFSCDVDSVEGARLTTTVARERGGRGMKRKEREEREAANRLTSISRNEE